MERSTTPIPHFNPRSPCGERPPAAPRPSPGRHFNPRSPCGERPFWGQSVSPSCLYFNPRSPCGERLSNHISRLPRSYFNPRSPCGERLAPTNVVEPIIIISIHAPRVGSDVLGGDIRLDLGISIHAPRVGSDSGRTSGWPGCWYFNPRSPCGERQKTSMVTSRAIKFQSTLPVWGATTQPSLSDSWIHISIHAPRVGSDPYRSYRPY